MYSYMLEKNGYLLFNEVYLAQMTPGTYCVKAKVSINHSRLSRYVLTSPTWGIQSVHV